jgi:aquaporin Z
MKSWQKYTAEVIGTFILVFVGSLAILNAGEGLAIAFGFGIALLGGLYAFGEVSGGHFNPIVSLALFLDRRLSAADTLWYWIAQFVGAILASLLIWLVYTSRQAVKNTATHPLHGNWKAWALELVCSALFVAVILQVTKSDRYGPSALIAIPLTLFVIHIAILAISGASVNPARTLGPDLVGATQWSSIWIYFTAPPLGAIVGWMLHMVTVRGDTSIGGDLRRAATDMRGVEMGSLRDAEPDGPREGPGQVPPPPSPSEPDRPPSTGPGDV